MVTLTVCLSDFVIGEFRSNKYEHYITLLSGYLVSTLSPSVQVASALGAPMMMPFLLFGGFFLKDA